MLTFKQVTQLVFSLKFLICKIPHPCSETLEELWFILSHWLSFPAGYLSLHLCLVFLLRLWEPVSLCSLKCPPWSFLFRFTEWQHQMRSRREGFLVVLNWVWNLSNWLKGGDRMWESLFVLLPTMTTPSVPGVVEMMERKTETSMK